MTIGSCAKTEDFYDIGLRLDTGGSAIGRNLVVFLLPKGVDATPLKLLPGVSYVGTGKGNQQIIASTTPEEIPARLELRRDLGPAFEFDGVKRVVGAVR
ncbi:hypothetical protein [Sinomonas humi]|uniref:hypothetical protein n=1 Tax=Sinomonas humi TaxID=1338436 RepID=UPI0012E011D8|nr:hypothetical protein [Sinomonas humi]